MKRRATDSRGPGSPPTVTIDGYTDVSRIGAGGFSVVYRAHEIALNRNVAVKVLNAGLANDDERSAFERECRALGQLDHPDIVRVYRSAYTVDDRPCIIMELYESNFRELLDAEGALAAVELLDVGVRMAVALHVAHSKGVLHRDVKPHNIFRSRYGDPALGDFGISTIIGERSSSGWGHSGGLSVAYAAPEVLEEAESGPATDVYALAATLFHLAAGQPPFASTDLRQVVRKILDDPPPPLSRTDLPPGFERVVRAALAKRPQDRPASALAFAESLREVQARAGHLQTPIKLERAPGEPSTSVNTAVRHTPLAPNGPPAAAPSTSVRPSTSVHPPTPAHSSTAGPFTPSAAPSGTAGIGGRHGAEDVSGQTIARRQLPAPAPVSTPDGPSRRRQLIAAAAVLAAVIVVIVGVFAFSGDDGSPTATTSSPTTVPPVDSFFQVVAAPSAVVVTAIDGGYSVSIPPVEGAERFIVTPVGSAGAPLTVTPAELPLSLVGEAAANCVVVQAVGAGGRVSREGGPFCAAPPGG